MTQKAIENHAGGTSLTGEGIELFRLLQIRSGFRLEDAGMRLSGKLPKMSTILRRQYGLKGNRDSLRKQLDQMIEDCQQRCAQQNAQAEAEEAQAEGNVH